MKSKLWAHLTIVMSLALPAVAIVSCSENKNSSSINVVDLKKTNTLEIKTIDDYFKGIKSDLINETSLDLDKLKIIFTKYLINVDLSRGTSKGGPIGNKYQDIDNFILGWNDLSDNEKSLISLANFTILFAKKNDTYNIAQKVADEIARAYLKYKEKTKNNIDTKNPNNVDNFKGIPVTIYALKKKYPKYYATLTNDMTGKILFDSLNSIQKKYRNHVGTYGKLWEIYENSFGDEYDEKDGTLYDIYSERVGQKDDFEFNMPDDQNRGSSRNIGDTYNREHIIPQSYFGKKTRFIHDDAHFVFPTDSSINGYRSNYVHDEVNNARKMGSVVGGNDWKLGPGVHGESNAFEPDDNFKGDVARAYFYFQLTWHDYNKSPYGGFSNSEYPAFVSSFPFIKNSYIGMYIKWSKEDPIDLFNVNINNRVAEYQGGLRNPFVDMPSLIELIWE